MNNVEEVHEEEEIKKKKKVEVRTLQTKVLIQVVGSDLQVAASSKEILGFLFGKVIKQEDFRVKGLFNVNSFFLLKG